MGSEAFGDAYKQLFDNIMLGAIIYEPIRDGEDFIIVDINTEGERISNSEKKDIVGKKITEAFPQAESFGILGVMRDVYTDGTVRRLPLTQYVDDKVTQWSENTVFKLENGNIVAIYNDLTESKRNAQKYQALFEFAVEGIFIHDLQGNVVDINKIGAEILGYTREEMKTRAWGNTLAESEKEKSARFFERLLTTGSAIEETKFVKKDGSIVDFEVNSKIIDVGLGLKLIQSNIRNISERNKYESGLQALHTHASKMAKAETMDEIALVTYETNKDVIGNDRGNFAIVEEEHLFHKYRWNMEDSEPFRMRLDGAGITVRVVNTGETELVNDVSAEAEYFTTSPEREIKTRSELAVPVKSGDKVIAIINLESTNLNAFDERDKTLVEIFAGHVALAMDRLSSEEERIRIQSRLLEESIRAEKERELSQLKTKFISTATHELRTPLTSIQGYIEIIQERGIADETTLKYLDVVIRNVQRLAGLTDDLLDIQRLESGRVKLDIQEINLKSLIMDNKDELAPILSERSQKLEVELLEDISLRFDGMRINQVLVNLLGNASKFSPDGSIISLIIEVSPSEVKFAVKDNGIGLREEDIPKLFTPFPDIEHKPNISGTGLGLSICKNIVELHGGKIWAESEGLKKGTTFVFTLPQ